MAMPPADHGMCSTGPPLATAACSSSGFITASDGAEVDGAGIELLDAGARADALVVDRGAGALQREVLDPLLGDRLHERRAGAGDGAGRAGHSAAVVSVVPELAFLLLPQAPATTATATISVTSAFRTLT